MVELRDMERIFTITNPKYFRAFDNTDNPCCWQVDVVGRDVEDVLRGCQIDFEPMYEDWGTSFSWTSRDGIVHSITVWCSDTGTPTFQLKCQAFKRRWVFFLASIPEAESDFSELIPVLKQLDQP
jgi:hypothetical protein